MRVKLIVKQRRRQKKLFISFSAHRNIFFSLWPHTQKGNDDGIQNENPIHIVKFMRIMCFQHEFSHALSSILFIIAQARKKDELIWKLRVKRKMEGKKFEPINFRRAFFSLRIFYGAKKSERIETKFILYLIKFSGNKRHFVGKWTVFSRNFFLSDKT